MKMFKPFIAKKGDEYAICRKVCGLLMFNERVSRFDWGTKESRAYTYTSYGNAEHTLSRLLNPPKELTWEPAKPPIQINTP